MKDDELRMFVRKTVRDELAALLGEREQRVLMTTLSESSGIPSSTLRMRCRRVGIETRPAGRTVSVDPRDVNRLLGIDDG